MLIRTSVLRYFWCIFYHITYKLSFLTHSENLMRLLFFLGCPNLILIHSSIFFLEYVFGRQLFIFLSGFKQKTDLFLDLLVVGLICSSFLPNFFFWKLLPSYPCDHRGRDRLTTFYEDGKVGISKWSFLSLSLVRI